LGKLKGKGREGVIASIESENRSETPRLFRPLHSQGREKKKRKEKEKKTPIRI